MKSSEPKCRQDARLPMKLIGDEVGVAIGQIILETAFDRFVPNASDWAGQHLALYVHSSAE